MIALRAHPIARPSRSRRGQALVEVVVGLIAIVALIAGLLQITSLSRAHSDTRTEARAAAAREAMDPATLIYAPVFVGDVQAGPDGARYSVDDRLAPGSTAPFLFDIVDRSAGDGEGWQHLDAVPGNPVSRMRASAVPTLEFGFVRAQARRTVPVLGAAQRLFFNRSEVEVETEVWMPWMTGLY
jgi:hypothetical protein